MNSVNITGRLTADPQLRTTAKGEKMARFTLAVDRESSDKEADFIRCIAFRQSAEYMTGYTKKGDTVGVSGKIRTGSYEDRDGKKVYTTDIFADRVERLHKHEPKADYPSSGTAVRLEDVSGQGSAGTVNDYGEDLPF